MNVLEIHMLETATDQLAYGCFPMHAWNSASYQFSPLRVWMALNSVAHKNHDFLWTSPYTYKKKVMYFLLFTFFHGQEFVAWPEHFNSNDGYCRLIMSVAHIKVLLVFSTSLETISSRLSVLRYWWVRTRNYCKNCWYLQEVLSPIWKLFYGTQLLNCFVSVTVVIDSNNSVCHFYWCCSTMQNRTLF